MKIRRAHTYKLFRQTKTQAFNVITSLVMVASSIGGALPLAFAQTASAQDTPLGTTELRLSSATPAPVEAGTGTTSFSVKADIYNQFRGKTVWTDINTGTSAATITATTDAGQLQANCSGAWLDTATLTISPSTLWHQNTVQGTFCYRSNTIGSHTISLSDNVPYPALHTTITDTLQDGTQHGVPVTVVDTVAPEVPQPTAPQNGGWSNTHGVTLGWTGVTDVSGVTYEIRYSTSPARDPSSSNNGELSGSNVRDTASITGTSTPVMLTDGTWFWQVRAVDGAGNPSVWSNIWSTKVDSVLPTVTVNLNRQSYVNSGAVVRSAQNPEVVTADSDGISNIIITKLDGTPVNGGGDITGAPTTRAANISWLGEGTYLITAKDVAGNVSTPFQITIDNTKPTGSVTSSAPVMNNSGTITVTAHDNVGLAKVSFIETDANGNNLSGTHPYYVWQNFSGTTDKSLSVDLAHLNGGTFPDGVHHIKVSVQDIAGNIQVLPVYTFTVDNTPPTITVKDGYVGNFASKTFSSVSFKLHDAYQVDKYVLNEGTPSAWTRDFTNNANSDANFANIKGHLLEGDNTLTLYDVAGNSTTYTFTYDSTPPTGTFAYSNNGGQALTNGDVTVTLNTSEAVQDITGWTRVSPTEFTKVFTDNGPFSVTLVDLAGNSSVVSGTVKRIDRKAPTITGISDGDVVKGPVHLSIFDPAYEGYFGFDALHGLTINGVETPTTETSDHHFLADVRADGTYTIVATDKAGNQTQLSFTIDTQAPDVSITAPSAGDVLSYAKDGTVTVRGSVTDAHPDHYYLKIYGPNFSYAKTVPATTSFTDQALYSWNLQGLTSGDYVIDLEAADALGNKDSGSIQKIHVTIDNDGPVIDDTGGALAKGNVINPNLAASDAAGSLPLTYTWTTDASNPAGAAISDSTTLNPDFTVTSSGSYQFILTAKDSLGNTTPYVFTFTYTAPPQGGNQAGEGSGNGGSNGGGDTSGGGGFTDVGGHVLGATTTVAATVKPTAENSGSGNIKGDKTVNITTSADKHSNFLGLGWWWLLVLAAVALVLWLILAGRRSEKE